MLNLKIELISWTAVSKIMEWTVSEDHQWRQLGSIVNAVLMDARTKAIRQGAVSTPPLRTFPRKTASFRTALMENTAGNGFLSKNAPAQVAPAQLELPFGIASGPRAEFGPPHAPRGARLT
jgi:hypothetical protein